MLPAHGTADGRGGPVCDTGTPVTAQAISAPVPVAPAAPDRPPARGDRYVWINPDGARVYLIVSRVSRIDGAVLFRCHYGDKVWTRKQKLPLFPSMHRQQWTTTDLKETLQ